MTEVMFPSVPQTAFHISGYEIWDYILIVTKLQGFYFIGKVISQKNRC
jgi:hypothetical protein